jgi:hypothetical protein
MVFRSPSDGTPNSLYQQSFGTPGQTKVSGDQQRETTHEICCLPAELSYFVMIVMVHLLSEYVPYFVSLTLPKGYPRSKGLPLTKE